MKLGLREAIISPVVFGVILLMLASVDERVKDRFTTLVAGGDGLSPWGERLAELGDALLSAVRTQSIENAPLVLFATVGVTLVFFMVRS
jgi:hypothetical protein